MTISLAHPEDFVIRAELLAGLDRLNLGSTRMSNGSQRNRLILRLFLGDYGRGLERENRWRGQILKSVRSLGRIIGNHTLDHAYGPYEIQKRRLLPLRAKSEPPSLCPYLKRSRLSRVTDETLRKEGPKDPSTRAKSRLIVLASF